MTSATFTDYSSETRSFSGAEKAAALLLAMGKPIAARLMKHFDQLELRQITHAAAHLGAVPNTSLELLVDEFTDNFSVGVDLLGNAGEVEQLLTGALPPEEAAEILSDVFGSSNSSLWEKLTNVQEARFGAYLDKEHPQTAAYIVSKLDAAYAAKVVKALPRDLRNEVLRRMMSLGATSDEALRIVENALQKDFLSSAAKAANADSRARIADIVNKLEPAEADDVIRCLAETQPKDAEILKKMLFSFDDLLRLSMRARSTLFDNVSTDIVVLALRGTEESFRDAVLSSMASRARRLVESELNNGPAVPQRDIAKARRAIAETVLNMVRRNEIELESTDDVETPVSEPTSA